MYEQQATTDRVWRRRRAMQIRPLHSPPERAVHSLAKGASLDLVGEKQHDGPVEQ